MTESYQTIWLHQNSPIKPAAGAPCNGCGVCCAITPCPLARVRFARFWRPLPKVVKCPALSWSDEGSRYECGLLTKPKQYWRWVPSKLHLRWQLLVSRWIATGIGCDCTSEIEE